MNYIVRDGKFDVVVVAGPRVDPWPSAGVRALSAMCTEMGLSVGLIGGDTLSARGVIPLSGTGGLVFAEDPQHRIHRIQARAVVRLVTSPVLPDPFPGWISQGLIPLSTAIRLRKESYVRWDPAVGILGSGNGALRFGSSLLESGVKEVFCVESNTRWNSKSYAGWEVERRRFEILGGKILEAKPLSLTKKMPLVWELRLEDTKGIRIVDIARLVSAGPFRDLPALREYPPSSLLFELEQTAAVTRGEDVEGWSLEEERGRWLACKIAKSLMVDLGAKRDELERVFRRTRLRLKKSQSHRENPFAPIYQGKWISSDISKQIRASGGVPQQAYKQRPMVSVECFESIPCDICEKVCPESAISMSGERGVVLNESGCTACGICVVTCPSVAIFLIQEHEDRSMSRLTLPWRGNNTWKVGEFAGLTNRRGESLGTGRIIECGEQDGVQLVQLDVPTHLLWEARGLRKLKSSIEDESLTFYLEDVEKIGVTLDGDKRLVRAGVPISVALFEIGQARRGDVLLCRDGSCGLCQVSVDGVNKVACQTEIHRGMAISLKKSDEDRVPEARSRAICPCMEVEPEQVTERTWHGRLQSPEAVLSVTHVGEGRCHGQLCSGAFRRLLLDQGLDASQWIDWRFPSTEWVITPGLYE